MGIINPGGGGGGNTDLSITLRTATSFTIASSTGAGALTPQATTLLAGLLTAADKKKLEGIANTCITSTYSFVNATSQISDDGLLGTLGDLAVVGQLIVVTGTVSNDGTYTVASIIDANTITVIEALTDEAAVAAEICSTTVGPGTQFTAAATAPTSPSYGDLWWDTVNEILFIWISDGTSDLWLDISSAGAPIISNWATGVNYEVGITVFEENRLYKCLTAHTSTTFGADRANWQVLVTIPAGSAWTAATYYYADDLVVESDKLYRRNTSGTSGATFDATEQLDWTLLAGGGGIDDWLPSTSYEVDDDVFEENRIYSANTAHTSGLTFDADRANWDVKQPVPLLAFQGNTYYYATENVLALGNVWTRNTSGTSGATFDVTEQTNWTAQVVGVDIVAWTGSTDYEEGQLTYINNRILKANSSFTSEATFDGVEAVKWTVVSPLQLSTWVTGTYYYIGDKVVLNTTTKDILVCVAPHVSSGSFNTDIANWSPLTISADIEAWVSSRAYYQGDTVVNNGLILRRTSSGISQGTFNTIEASQWEAVGVTEYTDWQPNTSYSVNALIGTSGSRVLQNATSHTSGATFDAVEAGNWRLISLGVLQAWAATTYYYVGEQVHEGGVLYSRSTAGVSGATFDATEVLNWRAVGTFSTPFVKTITDADSPYTVLETDEYIFIDSSSGAVTFNLDDSLSEGKSFVMAYTQTANAITVAGTSGATVMSPVTYTQVASFTAPGSVGQQGTTSWFKVGSEFLFNG